MHTSSYDVLVTGGAGFVGSAIINHLLKKGYSVVCFDTITETYRLDSSAPNLYMIKGDVLDKELVDLWVSKCGRVMHLAAVVGVDHYIQSPIAVLDINIIGTRNVLMSCLAHQRPVLLASTSEVYGKNYELLEEDSNRIYGSSANSRWSYAISKSAAEHYAHSLGKQGLVYTIIRYFNVYGPKMDATDKDRVVGKFIAAIRDKKPFVLVDGGKAMRSFCYIDDAVIATTRLAMELTPTSKFFGLSINIGRNEPVTIKHLAHLMIRLSGHSEGIIEKSGTSFFGEGFEEIPYRAPNVSRLEDVLGFKAEIDLEEGITKTLEYRNFLKPQSEKKPKREEEHLPIIPVIRPIIKPTDELLNNYKKSLKSGWLSNNGPNVREFEAKLAAYLNVPSVVVVSNGADAIQVSLQVMKVKGKVILPSYTFIATLNAVLANNLTPVFCDIDPGTFTICPKSVQEIMQRETDIGCIIPVNVFGVAPDLSAIEQIAQKADIPIFYDNAHGFGAEINGMRISSIPTAQSISFHATKALPAIEGGLIISPDENILNEIRLLRNHGIAPNLLQSKFGMNSKMDELRAITGLHSLGSFETTLNNRRLYGNRLRSYIEQHCKGAFQVQKIPDGIVTNFQNFGMVSLLDIPMSKLILAFKNQGVEARTYFNPALHHLEQYQGTVNLPQTDAVFASLVCLPLHSYMSEVVLSRIEAALSKVSQGVFVPEA